MDDYRHSFERRYLAVGLALYKYLIEEILILGLCLAYESSQEEAFRAKQKCQVLPQRMKSRQWNVVYPIRGAASASGMLILNLDKQEAPGNQ